MRSYRKLPQFVAVVLLALVVLAVFAPPVHGVRLEKSAVWKRLDVDLTVQPNGDLRVIETHEVAFTGGPFHYGYRSIPTDRLTGIDDVSVVDQSGRKYTSSSSGEPYTFRITEKEGDIYIYWYFPYGSDMTKAWNVSYTVHGALRYYDSGDQLWWKAVFPDRTVPVRSSTVTVHLPGNVPVEKYQAYFVKYTARKLDDHTVQFQTTEQVPPNTAFEIRVQFPHGLVAGSPAPWQQKLDRQEAYNKKWRPLVELLVGLVSLLLLVGGLIGLYLMWLKKGRDPRVNLPADYLNEPPDDLLPGQVGVLIDEKVDLRDVLAILIGLAHKGYIQIKEIEKKGFLFSGKDFEYVLLKSPDQTLAPSEKKMIEAVFGERKHRKLSDLKDQFYVHLPELKKALYKEVVDKGLFVENPQKIRTRYLILGIVVAVIGVLGLFPAAFLGAFALDLACIPLTLIILGIALAVVGRYMPLKTRKGAESAARWKAFKRYLEHIEKYTDLEKAKDIYDRYLPYAIAFGLERSFTRKFAQVQTPAPAWWVPVGHGHWYGAPDMTEDTGLPGAAPSVGHGVGHQSSVPATPGGLDGMSQGMFASLDQMSDGLFSMLNDASSTFKSSPSSSDGGGGWSGGGGFGGGGGGGGGGGFG